MAVTAKTFKRQLTDIVKGIASRRDKLQELLVFGFDHFEAKGDSVYLNMVLNQCVGVSALRTNTMKNYIEHVANVNCVGKAGEYVFKKKKGEEPSVNREHLQAVMWYQHDKDGEVKVFDAVKSAKSLLNQTKRAREGQTKTGTEIQCADVEASLELERALEAWLRVQENKANKVEDKDGE